MKTGVSKKTCFVIAPIGEEGSDTRRRSDQVLEHVIKPSAKECGYEAVRADAISEPGIITSQIIQHLLEDDLVIADLSGRNPNVFYELAVRHAVKKPVVQIIQSGESIPFDVAATRTIQVDHHDLDSVAQCRDGLARQIKSVEQDPSEVDSPISVAVDLQSLRQSENPLEKSNAEILSMLQDIRSMISETIGAARRPKLDRHIFEELVMLFDRLSHDLLLPPKEEPTRDHFEHAQHTLYRFARLLEMIGMECEADPEMVRHLLDRVRRRIPNS
jgi:hypothetical protein